MNASFSYSGVSTLNASVSESVCGLSTSRSLGIQAGVYSTSQFSITGPTETCPDPYNNEVYISMNNSPAIVDGYNWTYSSAWGYGYSPSGNDYKLVPPGPGFSIAWVKLSIQNSCGWSVPYQWDVYESSGCSGHRGFMVGPNPAKDVLTLTFEEQLKPEEMLEKIELYSEKTTRLAKTVSENEKAQSDGSTLSITVGDLPRGIYFLHVTDSHFEGEKTKRFRISLQ